MVVVNVFGLKVYSLKTIIYVLIHSESELFTGDTSE